MQNKSVQIPYELFFQLLQYFLMDNYDGEEIIRLGLEKKLDAMVNREVYSKSKTAPTEEENTIQFLPIQNIRIDKNGARAYSEVYLSNFLYTELFDLNSGTTCFISLTVSSIFTNNDKFSSSS